VQADRSRRLAARLNEIAAVSGVRLWLFFDHPTVVFGDEPRWALTAFVDQALRLDHLRVVLAGFEAMQMPGAQFETRFDADGDGPPGFVVEYLTGFRREDVTALISRAAGELELNLDQAALAAWTEQALEGLQDVNGRYESWMGAQVSDRLRQRLIEVISQAEGDQ